MANDPRWITADEIVAINARQVASSNEPHLLLRRDSLESAVARPQQHFAYSEGSTDVLDLAIALLLGIAQNHPFQQGNKRTAFVAFVTFLDRNGYDLDAPDEGAPVATAIIDVLEKRAGPDRFRDFIAPFVKPFDAL